MGRLNRKDRFYRGSGYSYVGALKKDGKLFVIALLGCSWPPYKTRKWSDAGILFSYGLKNYNKTDLYKHLGKTEPEKTFPVHTDIKFYFPPHF